MRLWWLLLPNYMVIDMCNMVKILTTMMPTNKSRTEAYSENSKVVE